MKQYTFHYGHGSKSFTLDENRVLNEIRMPETPVMENIAQGVLRFTIPSVCRRSMN